MEAINNDKNCKTLWRHLKDLNSTTDHNIDMITYEDKNLTDKIDIVNCLNDHLSSVGEKLIPHPHSNFESEKINNYVKSKINDNTLFSLYTVTNGDVFKYPTNLDINKSTGTDGVGPRILKVSKSVIADSLTNIINLSLCTGSIIGGVVCGFIVLVVISIGLVILRKDENDTGERGSDHISVDKAGTLSGEQDHYQTSSYGDTDLSRTLEGRSDYFVSFHKAQDRKESTTSIDGSDFFGFSNS
ncbi:unnamed protein product [Mytilus coruscus]|uniref:Uncharacterized protein n=1 Tax=Mytilus coruscus TaxID=42192 RepID=A0A6J8CQG5_MYTCO|nr:unnamed protein product [Mytilus coruscus]